MRPKAIALATLTFAAAFGIFACKARISDQQATTKFAILDTNKSLLKHISARAGELPVCLALIGFTDEDRGTAEARFRTLISKAANAWNSLLI
jgi:hypothetical protein